MWLLTVLGVLLVVLLMLAVGASAWPKRACCSGKCERSKRCCDPPIYGEFIQPFTAPGEDLALPIVQPGESVVFPVPTVEPLGVSYVDEPNRVGLLVPEGVYLASWTLMPSTGAAVDLLVNGKAPESASAPTQYAYTQSLTTGGLLANQFLFRAPLAQDNLVSLVNAGNSLFSLAAIPNSLVAGTSINAHVRIQRLSD